MVWVETTTRTTMSRRRSLLPPLPVSVADFILQGMFSISISRLCAHCLSRPIDPSAYGDPYARPLSTVSTASTGVESAWRRRQTIKRGVTRKVQLTKGNFITEYAAPSPVYTAIEDKWKSNNTTEFSSVICGVSDLVPILTLTLKAHAVHCCDM